jgi:hypothetical protein
MEKAEMIFERNPMKSSHHQHRCLVEEHYFDCAEDCECICGLPMNGNDHSECPIELRPCPEHKAEWERSLAEGMSNEKLTEIEPFCEQQDAARLHNCECGCEDIDASLVVGWCLHCSHVYEKYSSAIQDRHLAYDCAGAPEGLKQYVLASLGRRQIRH